jgi:peptide/nickel transport system substrate-binding protein
MHLHRRNFLKTASATTAATLLPAGFWSSVLHAQPNDGKTLVVALPTNPITIDPINQLSHDAMLLGQTVFENLVEYGVDGNLRPQLAAALPEVSNDQLSYTFDLRDDVVFHNGKPLTAEDVKYSFEWLLNPDNKASRRGVFARIKDAEVLDTHRVRINLKTPYSPWMYFLSKYMGIYPAGSREEHGPDHFRLSPTGVGTGVGVFEEWIPDTSITFSRNPNYWRKDLPAWEKLVVRLVPDTPSRMAFLQSGEIDIISTIPPQDFARMEALDGVEGEARPTTSGWVSLLFDNTKAPFDDVDFRLALSYAIDRDLLAEQVFLGFLEPSSLPAPPRGWWFDSETNATLGYDPAKAAEHLAKSKYASGASFEMNVATDPYLIDLRDAALAVQAMLGAIGVTANIMPMEFNVLTGKMVKGEHQSALTLLASPGEPTYMLQGAFTPGQAVAGGVKYQGTDIAELLDKAFATTDQDAQLAIYHDIQKAVAKSMPAVTIGYAAASALWRDRVEGFKVSQGITMNVAEVSV